MKKCFAFLLTLAMLLSLSVTAFAADVAESTIKVSAANSVYTPVGEDGTVTIKLWQTQWNADWTAKDGETTVTWTVEPADVLSIEPADLSKAGHQSATVTALKNHSHATITVTDSTGATDSVKIYVDAESYTLTYLEQKDGKEIQSIEVIKGAPQPLPKATRDGYTFGGWYYWKSGREKELQSDTLLSKDTTVYAKWEDAPNATPVATVGNDSYDTVEAAAVAVADDTEITINEATTIGNITVEAGSTVTAKTETAAAATNNAATVTPKTLTISKDGEETKTVKAYVVSSGTGDEAKSAVVTNVSKNSSVANETNSGDVSDYVNVAQVLANAATGSKKDGEAATFDASSITGMELSLITKNTNNAGIVTNETLQAAINDANVTVFDVYPLAKVTTKTTVDGTTSTETYEYDASNDLATGATFTVRLPVGSGLDAGKTAKLTHYHQETNDVWSTETIYGIVDQYGLVTVTLDKFSYITVDGLEYEVFGEVYDFDAVFGNKNEFNITFLYDESIRDNLDGYAVKLYLDDNGTERELTETSGSDYLNSDITTYKTDGVKAGSSGAKYQVFTVKMFAKYFASDIIVKLVKNDEAVNITSYNNSAFGISAEVGTQFGYSMVDFVDLKIAGFNAVSDSANAAKYTTLKSAITAYGSALSALD